MDRQVTLSTTGTMLRLRMVTDSRVCFDVVVRYDCAAIPWDAETLYLKLIELLELECKGSWVIKEDVVAGEDSPPDCSVIDEAYHYGT